MAKQIDRRILRTKRLIRDALSELMIEKGFDGVTVSDLTTKADINRGTFYIHYQDKYDLLEQSENELLERIEEIVLEAQLYNPKEVMKYIEEGKPLPHIQQLVEFFLENYGFVKTILGAKGDPSFHVKLKEVMKRNMLNHVQNLKETELLVPIDYLFAYVSSANLGVLQHWLENGSDESPTEIALMISRVTILGPGYLAGFQQ